MTLDPATLDALLRLLATPHAAGTIMATGVATSIAIFIMSFKEG
jgi:uncharacterized protein (DUF2062 family)